MVRKIVLQTYVVGSVLTIVIECQTRLNLVKEEGASQKSSHANN